MEIDLDKILADTKKLAEVLTALKFKPIEAVNAMAGMLCIMSLEANISEEMTLGLVSDVYRALQTAAVEGSQH